MTKPPTSDISQSSAAAGAVLDALRIIAKEWRYRHAYNDTDAYAECASEVDELLASTPQPPPEAGSVGVLQEWELLSMKFLAEALRKRGDDLSADAASWLEKFSAAPAPKESP